MQEGRCFSVCDQFLSHEEAAFIFGQHFEAIVKIEGDRSLIGSGNAKADAFDMMLS